VASALTDVDLRLLAAAAPDAFAMAVPGREPLGSQPAADLIRALVRHSQYRRDLGVGPPIRVEAEQRHDIVLRPHARILSRDRARC